MSRESDADNSFIAEALPAFISEAREQVEGIEQLLLQLEDAPTDRELLDALFRCAHTVKGSAGIFGLDRVVAFTHHVETLLDHLRDGHLRLTPALSTLLLQCNDQIAALVGEAAGGADAQADADGDAVRAGLIGQLQAASGQPATAAPAAAVAPAAPADAGAVAAWQLAVRFGADTFRNGMDPLAILNYVRQLGTVHGLRCDTAGVPALATLDAESCHLGFALALHTTEDQAGIEAAFSFVRDDAELRITPPAATAPADAECGPLGGPSLQALDGVPCNRPLGDMLVSVGAVTPGQLAHALKVQAEAGAQGVAVRIGEILETHAGVDPVLVDAAVRKQQKAREAGTDETRYIRVAADRLDAVINLLGELVIAGAGAALLARQTRQPSLIEANGQISRLVEEIRNGTLQLRMVPMGETFSRFRRVVRDTAAQLGKDVALEIVGGETELDKSMVERIADPLMHLVRNALDHGLEPPEARLAAGKPAQGRLTLSACHESGSVLIRISDDGRGIVRQRVLERAWQRGLVERGVVPPDDEILMLIFEAGFSTAEQVTNLSGRGVGMDVVRRNIQALRGTVAVRSTEGSGSTIEIRLPLTLAIIDGFLVGVGPSKFIFPLDGVVEVIESPPPATPVDGRGCSVVALRGRALPVISLRALYALESEPPERVSVVVIQSGASRYGVVVDQLLGQYQTVIKPLGRMFRSLRGMAGSSILGNGEVALIFDVNALCQLAADANHAPSPPARDAVAAPAPHKRQHQGQQS